MSNSLNEAATAPAALSAFLRGVERRGAVFAELLCGDRDAGDTALVAAMRAFRNHAGSLPMSDWPQRFWSLLVATPPLRQAASLAQWPRPLQVLASMEHAARQALLLRLAAGLPEDEAATALAVPSATYEQQLAQGCPRDGTGQPDPVAWRALAETIQQQVRDLPPDRLARLARLREAAIRGSRPDATSSVARPLQQRNLGPAAEMTPGRRRWPWVLAVVVVCASAMVATWWWPQLKQSIGRDHPLAPGVERLQDVVQVTTEDLPPSEPAARFDATTGLLSHPDFDLLMDSADEAIAQQADFYAWYSAGAGALPTDANAGAAAEAGQTPETGSNDDHF